MDLQILKIFLVISLAYFLGFEEGTQEYRGFTCKELKEVEAHLSKSHGLEGVEYALKCFKPDHSSMLCSFEKLSDLMKNWRTSLQSSRLKRLPKSISRDSGFGNDGNYSPGEDF